MRQAVNWFPGHQAKAARDIGALLGRVDVVVEVRDARLPRASVSPLLRSVLPSSLPLLVVLNKADLANPNLTHAFCQALPHAVSASAALPRGAARVLPACRAAVEEKRRKNLSSASRGPLHVLVVGVPNVGKSSLINALRGGGKAARVGATPGLTRRVGTFAVGSAKDPIYVIDSPGVLAPAKSIDAVDGRRMAICGIVKSSAVPNTEVHQWLLSELYQRGWDVDSMRLEHVIRQAGGALDPESAALAVLTRFRNGEFGRITFDKV